MISNARVRATLMSFFKMVCYAMAFAMLTGLQNTEQINWTVLWKSVLIAGFKASLTFITIKTKE